MALFEAIGLHKRFGDRIVLQDLSLTFEEGKLSGILGPNGAGTTTCVNVLTGRFAPDRGTVRFAGVDIPGEPPLKLARRGLSRSFPSMAQRLNRSADRSTRVSRRTSTTRSSWASAIMWARTGFRAC